MQTTTEVRPSPALTPRLHLSRILAGILAQASREEGVGLAYSDYCDHHDTCDCNE